MRITASLFLLLFVIGTSASGVFAQSLAHDRCQSFKKGMNISNWLERGWDENWPTVDGYEMQDLEKMREAGITSIRLPIYFQAVVDTIAPYTVDTDHILFDLVDSVIQWTEELDMKLLIDNHHGWDLSNENWRQALPRFSHVWGVVANRYQHLDPDRVMFELLNEPTLLFSKDSLLIMYNDAIDSIRQHTVDHSIIVGSHYGSTAMVIPQFEPLADTNLIYTWHTYDPLDFTHQGLTWHNPFFPAGNPFPNADTSLFEHWVYDGWQNILEWRQTHNKPIFIGEFGLDTYCDSLSSCNWLDYHMTRVVQNDISWFYWDWQWDFSMFNSHVISEDSIYPCHKYYLGLYGDDTFTNVENTEFKNEIGVNLYPNPSASGKFTLELDFGNSNAYNIEVYSNLGRLLYSQTFYGNKYLFEEALNPGFYLVNVETERGQTTKKFIVN